MGPVRCHGTTTIMMISIIEKRAINRGFHELLRGSSGRTLTSNHNAFQLLFTFSLLLLLKDVLKADESDDHFEWAPCLSGATTTWFVPCLSGTTTTLFRDTPGRINITQYPDPFLRVHDINSRVAQPYVTIQNAGSIGSIRLSPNPIQVV